MEKRIEGEGNRTLLESSRTIALDIGKRIMEESEKRHREWLERVGRKNQEARNLIDENKARIGNILANL